MLDDLPYAIRVLLESVLRQAGSEHITEQDVIALAGWSPKRTAYAIIPFLQMRVVMQDFTGVPAVVDLAAMQSALPKMGGATIFIPTGENMSIYEAATKYEADATHLIVLAGKEYSTGSSRDWTAKGTYLLGVRSVIAESYERIHRSNLIGVGVMPLEFMPGEGVEKLGLSGMESYSVLGIHDDLIPGEILLDRAVTNANSTTEFKVKTRIDTPAEMTYYRNGGILHAVIRQMLSGNET